MALLSVLAAPSDLIQGLTTALVTMLVVIGAVIIVSVALLVRRARRPVVAAAPDLAMRANILLVRLDDSLKQNDDELEFAIAQFGDAATREFAAAVAEAKTKLSEAFRLKQRLDDATPDTAAQVREWNARIVHLCETAQASLEQQADAFRRLRALETNAPANLDALRSLISATFERVPAAAATVDRLTHDYTDRVVATTGNNVAEAQALLAKATKAADDADSGLGLGGASNVATTVQDARSDAQQAAQLLDAIDNLDAQLGAASARMHRFAADTRSDLEEARAARDTAPDPDSSAQIGRAVTTVERALASLDEADPAASIDRLQSAIATLDSALAGARNQAERLEHARSALAGALLTARSQIATTRDFVASRRGAVGTDARTRLAEAERLLAIAEVEADPVTALDTARSSATYSRDADALARYDVL